MNDYEPNTAVPYKASTHRLILWAIAGGAIMWNAVASVIKPASGAGGVHFFGAPKPFLIAGIGTLVVSMIVRAVLHRRATEGATGGERMAASMVIVASAEATALLGGACIFLYQDPALTLVGLPWLVRQVVRYSPRG